MWRTRAPTKPGWTWLVFPEKYRLSTAAALVGLTNGFLYAVHGTWAYTSTVGHGVKAMVGATAGPSLIIWGLFASLVAGMGFSSWQRGRFHLDWRPSTSWLRCAGGGFLMGIAAAMIPGGNDVLILHTIPGLSPHALPAYGAMIVGIAGVLVMMRAVGGHVPKIDCSGNICRSE